MPDIRDYNNLENYNWLAAEVNRHEVPQANALGKLLREVLNPDTVIDVGCSSGIYLLPFKESGCYVLGIDGASGVGKELDIDKGEFKVVDLRKPWTPPMRFDLSLCIEVAEHVPPEFSDLLVETLCKTSNNIFFCAARPGQGGEGHVCERPREYWLEKFAKHGYGVHPKNDEIRAVINSDPVYSHCGWITWNSVLIGKQNV